MASATSKMTSWPRLDLNNLRKGSVIFFFKNYILEISVLSWGKWAIGRFSSQTYKIWKKSTLWWPRKTRDLKIGILKVWIESQVIAHFPQLNALILKMYFLKTFTEPLPRSLRSSRGQEVIFEVAEAKIWIPSSFYKFSFRIFVVFDFEVVWPCRPQRPRKRLVKIFWKWPQINANFPKINGRYES